MKFQQLAIGARFEYEGQVYSKTGPLSAASDRGGQRMIPRYADLRPLDGAAAEVEPKPGRKLDEAAVMAAFDAFHRDCARLVDESGRTGLAAARERFIAALK